MSNDTKPVHPVVRYAFYGCLLTFFGGGLPVFLNLFFHFLSEAAFAIIALVLLAEFMLLFVVAKCIQVISAMRSVTRASKSADECLASNSKQCESLGNS